MTPHVAPRHPTFMRLLSVNAGLPREAVWKGRRVATGILKEPVEGRVRIRGHNLEGDAQADLSVHGGRDKAVYAYPSEHYAFWRAELRAADLPFGRFGENLTTEGLREEEVRIGDLLRVGSARLVVTSPRVPCFKLALRFGREDMVKRFLDSRRTGFYLSVAREGDVGAGDPVEVEGRDEEEPSVAEVVRAYAEGKSGRVSPELLETLRRAAASRALPESWREHFARRLVAAGG